MINLRIKEHQRDVRLKHATQSALSEHNIETRHQILFDKTTIANITSYFLRKYKEAIKVHKHPNNKDNGEIKYGKPFSRLLKTDQFRSPLPPTILFFSSPLQQIAQYKMNGLEEQLNIRLLLALMKWIASTKRWHSKNGSGYEEIRKTHNLYNFLYNFL